MTFLSQRARRFRALALIVAAGCSIGKIGNGLDDDPTATPSLLSGRVVGESGEPLAAARVEAGDLSATTDGDGYWSLTWSGAPPATVTYFRRGFAPYTETLAGRENRHLEAVLQPALLTRTLTVADGGELALDRNGDGHVDLRLTFPAGFLDGVDRVDVSVSELAQDDPEFVQRFPGAFVSRDAGVDARRDLSHSFGALNVSFHQGDTLLRDVTLAQPVAVELTLGAVEGLAAGDVVDLAWLDTRSGEWVKDGEGIVVVQNGIVSIEGDVRHFTWWNFERDIDDYACVALTLDDTGLPSSFVERFELVVHGRSYAGGTPPVTVGADGVAVADGWRGQLVDVAYRYAGSGPRGVSAPVAAGTALQLAKASSGFGNLEAEDCQGVSTALAFRPGTIAGIVRDDVGQPVTDTVVAIAELGLQTRPNPSGYFEFRNVPWTETGVPLTVRALPVRGLRIAPELIANAAAETVVNLSATPHPRPPWFVSQTLSDSQPAPGATVAFSFTVRDDRPGLTWSALPTAGEIAVIETTESDDGSVYQLRVDAEWSSAVSGPAELRLRVEDAGGQSSAWTLQADWR